MGCGRSNSWLGEHRGNGSVHRSWSLLLIDGLYLWLLIPLLWRLVHASCCINWFLLGNCCLYWIYLLRLCLLRIETEWLLKLLLDLNRLRLRSLLLELSRRSDCHRLLGSSSRLIRCLNSWQDSAWVEDWKLNFRGRLIVILLLLLALGLETYIMLELLQVLFNLVLGWIFIDCGLRSAKRTASSKV